MSQFVSPRIVTDGLLLNLDASNKKSYKDNLLPNADTISTATWGWNQISVIPYACQAPDGTMTGIQVTSTGTDPYFNQAIAVEAGVTYTATCYIKATGSVVGKTSGYIWAWFGSTATGTNTFSNTVTLSNNWQKLSVTFTPTGSGNVLIRVDPDDALTSTPAAGDTYFIASLQVNRGLVAAPRVSTTTALDASLNDTSRAIGTYPAFTPVASKYLSYDTNGLKITRAAGSTKDGGRVYYDFTGTPLAAGAFLLNNHTWEVWFRIDDRNPGSTQGWLTNEFESVLAVFSGYHSGFYYNATNASYCVWDSANIYVPCSWSTGSSGSAAQIKEGSWTCLTVTRSGNVFTPYLNGVAGTPTTQATTITSSLSSNTLYIGATGQSAAGSGDFCFYSKHTFGAMKMYNRALSSTEVAQNFSALRGRFGI